MYRVAITARALADADAAHAWMTQHISPKFADQWYQELFQQIDTLKQHPNRCPLARESDKFTEEIRELIYGKRKHKNKYRIIFLIRKNTVVILHIHHGSRKDFELYI